MRRLGKLLNISLTLKHILIPKPYLPKRDCPTSGGQGVPHSVLAHALLKKKACKQA